jgi:hypothetical protein
MDWSKMLAIVLDLKAQKKTTKEIKAISGIKNDPVITLLSKLNQPALADLREAILSGKIPMETAIAVARLSVPLRSKVIAGFEKPGKRISAQEARLLHRWEKEGRLPGDPIKAVHRGRV